MSYPNILSSNVHLDDQTTLQLLTTSPTATHSSIHSPGIHPAVINIISSGMGSIITGFAMTPLDVISKRIQATAVIQPSNPPPSIINNANILIPSSNIIPSQQRQPRIIATFRFIIQTEGLFRLWTGLRAGLFMAIPNTIVYFSAYELLRELFVQQQSNYLSTHYNTTYPSRNSSFSFQQSNQRTTAVISSSIFPPLFAGVFSRLICTFIVSPIDLIRTRQQTYNATVTTPNSSVPSMLSIFRATLQADSSQLQFRNLYRGIGSTLLRDIPFSALYWVINEQLKGWFLTSTSSPFYSPGSNPRFSQAELLRLDRSNSNSSSIVLNNQTSSRFQSHHHSKPLSTWLSSFFSGATGGAIAAVCTHPFEVIKTAQQMNYSRSGSALVVFDFSKASILQTGKYLYKTRGIQGLFLGCAPRILKVAPACAVMLSSYDLTKRFFGGTPNVLSHHHSHVHQHAKSLHQD